MNLEAAVDDIAQLLLAAEHIDLQTVSVFAAVNKAKVLRNSLIVDEPADGGFHQFPGGVTLQIHSDPDLRVDFHVAVLIGHQHLVDICEYLAVALFRDSLKSILPIRLDDLRIAEFVHRVGNLFFAVDSDHLLRCSRISQVVRSQNHVLRRRGDRRAVLRRQDVVH